MKKIIAILFTAILVFVSIVQLYIYNIYYYSSQVDLNRTQINVIVPEGIDEKEVVNTFVSISQKYKVGIAKNVYIDDKTVHIFTTDSSTYKITKRKGKDQVITPLNDHKISINPMQKVGSFTGLSGNYTLATKNKNKVKTIVQAINSSAIGKASIENMGHGESSGFLGLLYGFVGQGNLPVLLLLIISSFIGLFIIIKVGIRESKKIAILQLQGLSKSAILKNIGASFSFPILLSLLLSMIGIGGFLWYKQSIMFLPLFVGIGLINWIILSLLGAFILFSVIVIIHRFNRKTALIKGYTANISVLFFQYILKYIMILCVVVAMLLMLDSQKRVQDSLHSNKNWLQAQNTYRLETKSVTMDEAENRKIDKSLANMYQELTDTNKIFLIDAGNYNNTLGQFNWEDNAVSDPDNIYSAGGKSILVNENYIKRHPVDDITGKSVLQSIVRDDTVLNVLVPISLKDKEEIIRKKMLEDFISQKITVAHFYDHVDTIETVDESQLKVNIMYVNDNTKYFTYDRMILPEQNNLVTDPIVIVDIPHNMDANYYMTYGNNLFFESHRDNPLSEISDTIHKYGMSPTYHTFVSIYNERAEEIQFLVDFIRTSTFMLGIIGAIYIFLSYILNQSYYEQYKYSIFVKRMQGYSVTKIFKRKLLLEILLDIGITILFQDIRITAIITFLDILLLYILTFGIYKNSIIRVLKGGLQ